MLRSKWISAGAFALGIGLCEFNGLVSANTVFSSFGNAITISDGTTFDGSSTYDMGTHDMLVFADDSDKADVFSWLTDFVKSGRNGGLWNGPGINSSAAAAFPNHVTGLAAVLNDDGHGNPLYTTYDGVPVNKDTIIIKYTWNGDADLTGRIDADDYFQIDLAYVTQLKNGGYRNGDFNYDGVVDSDDYFLIDCANMHQNGTLSDPSPLLAYPVPSSPAVPLPQSALAGILLLGGMAVVRKFRR